MNLQHITQEICPICSSTPVAETKKSQHCNGQWNESRRFACGCCIEYSPNFQRSTVVIQCPQHPEAIAKKNNRQSAKKKVIAFIYTLSCDDHYKEALLRAVTGID